MTRAERRVQLLYILGSSRSGSTLLSVLLSNHSEIQGVGELLYLGLDRAPSRSSNDPASPRERVCTCGEGFDTCPFWRRVGEILEREGLSLDATQTSVRLRPPFGRYALPAVPEVLLGIGSERLLEEGRRRSERVRRVLETAQDAWRIFAAAAEASGASVVADDSKRPDSALALYRTCPEGSSFRLVHLLRDGRASTYSIMGYRDLSMAEAAWNWRRRTIGALLAYSRIPRSLRMRVRYEDLCADPKRELRRICSFLGVPYEEGMELPAAATTHRFGGSSSPRLQAPEVRLDERWRRELGAEELRTFRRRAGPLNRLLGYR